MFNRDAIIQALFLVLLINLATVGYQHYYGEGEKFSVIEAMPSELQVKAPTSGKNRYIRVETDTFTLWIDKMGGRIARAVISGTNEPFFETDSNGYLDTQSGFTGDAQLNYSSAKTSYILDGKNLTVTLNAENKKGIAFKKHFEFEKGSFAIKVRNTVMNNTALDIQTQAYYVIGGDKLSEKKSSAPSPKDLNFETKLGQSMSVRDYSGVSFSSIKKPYVRMKFQNMKNAKADKTKGGWMAFQKHHFIAAWVFEKNVNYRINNFFVDGVSKTNGDNYEQQFATQALSSAYKLSPGEAPEKTATLYIGEQSVTKLVAVDPQLRLTMDYGFFWLVTSTLHKVLRQLHNFIPNWSLCFFILIMATKMLMFKSVRDQALHAKKSKIMEPEKQIIEKRFENDSWNPERYEAISALHKKYDAGFKLTLLMPLLQMPLMLAFFSIAQIAVEFRHERFFWIADMSQKDPYYILPVLASVMMMLQFSSTSAQQNSPMGDEYKMVFKLMPLLMLYMARQWPAVACFYLVSNAVLSFAQDKLLALSK